jgi:uncharacterized SAM-binding protein YcdF (DUF218 family)
MWVIFNELAVVGEVIFIMFVAMFFELSKVLDFLVTPFYWVLGCFLAGWLLRKRKPRTGKFLLRKGIILSLILTNPFIIDRLLSWWEVTPYPSNQLTEVYDAGILLGGSMKYYDETSQRPVYSLSADRLLQTLALYREGKIRKIILTGGSGQMLVPHHRESQYVREVLLGGGVKEDDILIENESRNTYENAKMTAELIREKNIDGKFLIITSAFHMRRTVACFKKAGLDAAEFPVDPKAVPFHPSPYRTVMPDPFAFVLWNQLVHEWVGMGAYKVAGYI